MADLDQSIGSVASNAIEQFIQSTKPSAWSYLDKTEILTGMIARLHNPLQVKQGGQPFCGPAVVLFELIRKYPYRYVDLCRGLFEDGCFMGEEQRIVASTRLRRSHGDLRMAQVDWLILATLRDQANWLVPVRPQAPSLLRNLAGITGPWDVTYWIKNLLGYAQVLHYYTPWGGELAALEKAQMAIDRGGIALALIDQGLLNYKVPCFSYPNHWVSILGNVGLADRACFDCYSWGRQVSLTGELREVRRHLWGMSIAYGASEAIAYGASEANEPN
jgi:hypothetical protein